MSALIQKAFNTATLGMAFVGLDGKWTQVNASLCELLGYSEKELCALTLQEIAPPEDPGTERPTVHQLIRNVANGYDGEERFCHKNGDLIWVIFQAWLVRDDAGRPQCYFAQLHDITSRKGMERTREAMFELPTALHFVANFDGYFTRLSPSWSDFLGYPQQHLLSIPYLDLVHPDDREKTSEEALRISEGCNTFLFENRYRHADGSYRWILWTAMSRIDDRLIYGVALDYTARKEMELELQRALLAANSLLSDLSASQKEIAKLREGLLTICAWTKRIRYEGRWIDMDEFLRDHLHLNLTHGMSEEAYAAMMKEDEKQPPA